MGGGIRPPGCIVCHTLTGNVFGPRLRPALGLACTAIVQLEVQVADCLDAEMRRSSIALDLARKVRRVPWDPTYHTISYQLELRKLGGFQVEARILRNSGHHMHNSNECATSRDYHHLSIAERDTIMWMREAWHRADATSRQLATIAARQSG